MVLRLDAREAGFYEAFARLLTAKRETAADVETAVREIVTDVRQRGDAAVLAWTQRLDGIGTVMADLRVSPSRLEEALRGCNKETLKALHLAHDRIHAFHETQKPQDFFTKDDLGVRMGWRWTPVDAAGLYVPGGTASYPSSVLMNAIPAKVTGVERLVMVVPALKGEVSPLVLAAAKLCGIEEIYTIGGAQAIAALAYGTASIKPVAKITGPGNAYVAAAKRLVFGQVGIDMIAGPSEVVIVAGKGAHPDWIAADLLAQAEHDVAAQALLITDDDALAEAVPQAVARQLAALPRRDIAQASWEHYGAIVRVAALEEALPLINALAPEHLEIETPENEEQGEILAQRVRHAGAIFLGSHTPEALGDYVAGPNHVLPTARSARFSSGLGVMDFLKRTTFLSCPPDALAVLGPAAQRLAKAEGLDGHARSIAVRMKEP
jgi:histidinol dehydrogenase